MKYPRIKDYPCELEIGPNGSRWEVKWLKPSDERGWCGLAWYDKRTIFIELGQTPKKRFETFIHELCHAFAWEFGIKFLHHHTYIKKLETFVPAFLVNNGYLKRFP